MRLDFNVLWVDDQPERVESQVTAIAREMREEGFEFKPLLCRSVEEVRQANHDHVFADEIDLILVDWDLGEDLKGQDAIDDIRRSIPYKDVVFYSGQTQPGELKRLAFETGLEGVYCASREELVQEVIGVFESLIKKVLDLDHARGIVMGATADIDNMVNESLVAMYGRLKENEQGKMLEQAFERIDERTAGQSKAMEKLKEAATMEALFAAHHIFTANDRLRTLSRALELEVFKEHAGRRVAVVDYMNYVVPERNILGHQVLLPEGNRRAVMNSAGTPITVAEVRLLRRRILDLRDEFRLLLIALKGA